MYIYAHTFACARVSAAYAPCQWGENRFKVNSKSTTTTKLVYSVLFLYTELSGGVLLYLYLCCCHSYAHATHTSALASTVVYSVHTYNVFFPPAVVSRLVYTHMLFTLRLVNGVNQ